MYTKRVRRLEPLGLEIIAEAARRAGHDVRLIDLQVESEARYWRLAEEFRPEAVAFSCNYLANVPQIIDLAKATKRRFPGCFVFVGRHSASMSTPNAIAATNHRVSQRSRNERRRSAMRGPRWGESRGYS